MAEQGDRQQAKSILQRIIAALLFCVFTFALICACNWLFFDDNTYVRLQFHELHEEDSIEVVFLGSSMAYRCFDPEVWDEVLGVRSFNLGTSSQRPSVSYAIMQEVFATQSPKYCIYACRHSAFYEGDINDADWAVYDGLARIQSKAFFIGSFLGDASLTEILLPFARSKPISPSSVITNIKTKTAPNYVDYGYKIRGTATEEYAGRGFVRTFSSKEDGKVGKLSPLQYDRALVSPKELSYFRRLAELCAEHCCKLIIVIPPCPKASMVLTEDYQGVVDLYRQVADSCDVSLYDFTLAKPELFNAPDSYYYDHSHLNGVGADMFSAIAADLIARNEAGSTADYSALFYNSFDDLLDSEKVIYNVWLEDEGDLYRAYYSSGNDVNVNFQFAYQSEDESELKIIGQSGTSRALPKSSVPEDATTVWVIATGSSTQGSSQQQGWLELKP